jgi:hypothetical protein
MGYRKTVHWITPLKITRMKKFILPIVAFCFTSTMLFASSDPDQSILTLPTNNYEWTMTPSPVLYEVAEESMSFNLQPDSGCAAYGVRAAWAENVAFGYGYGQLGEWGQIYLDILAKEYQDLCKEAGGADFILDPIFL